MTDHTAARPARAERAKARPRPPQPALTNDEATWQPSDQHSPSITSASVLSLQRTVGNSAVNGLLQRQVFFKQMTGERTSATADQVTNWLRQGSVSIAPDDITAMISHPDEFTFNWAYGQTDFSKKLRELKHAVWMITEYQRLLRQVQKDPSAKYGPLLSHEQTVRNPLFKHYNLTDNNMVWRFTSTPSESIWISPGVSYEEIIEVSARHSGGNDKSNPHVKTLSFGRNIGALMGTAASKGGDKQVTNIIDKAEYLFGIDIGSLAAKGVSAHPATSRAISLFETEYILVSTPGNPPLSLDELATVKYANPFKGTQAGLLKKVNAGGLPQYQAAVDKMGTIAPGATEGVQQMSKAQIDAILVQAQAATTAANAFSGMVRDKEDVSQQEIAAAIPKYIEMMTAELKKLQK